MHGYRMSQKLGTGKNIIIKLEREIYAVVPQ